jgi:NAD(P)-dependent dehydrogenase (short-subunit alcohol dehydrogenase family)
MIRIDVVHRTSIWAEHKGAHMAELATGKVALVTGGGSGIGRASAELFAAEGAKMVVAGDIDADSAAETAELISQAGFAAVGVGLDVADRAAVHELCERIADEHGSLDAAVNCAGVRGPTAMIADYDPEAWRQVMAINLDGIFYCMQAEIKAMRRSGGGAIVNIASGAVVDPRGGLSPYGASKAAVVHLTRTAALECAADGIRVNVILPGRTRTAMLEEYYKLTPGAEEAAVAQAPLGRIGLPSETANAIVWLCSDCSSYVDGVSLLVDGGQHAGRSF